MKKLGIRNITLIRQAINRCGWEMDNVIAYVEEQLYVDEAMMVINYLKWLQGKQSAYAFNTDDSYEKAFQKFKVEVPQKTRKKGRPINLTSKRQARLASYEEKRKKGIEVKPGRPKLENNESTGVHSSRTISQ